MLDANAKLPMPNPHARTYAHKNAQGAPMHPPIQLQFVKTNLNPKPTLTHSSQSQQAASSKGHYVCVGMGATVFSFSLHFNSHLTHLYHKFAIYHSSAAASISQQCSGLIHPLSRTHTEAAHSLLPSSLCRAPEQPQRIQPPFPAAFPRSRSARAFQRSFQRRGAQKPRGRAEVHPWHRGPAP
jgi:hypothetical protein